MPGRLRECRKCHKDVPLTANLCPSCGTRWGPPTWVKGVAYGGAFVVGVLFLVAVFAPKSKTDDAPRALAASIQREAPPTPSDRLATYRDRLVAGIQAEAHAVVVKIASVLDGKADVTSSVQPEPRRLPEPAEVWGGGGGGPHCTKGCRCGNACISCSKRCTK